MKLLKAVVCLGILATGIASAASHYNVTFHQATKVAGTELKPGDYRIELNGEMATISGGKQTVQAPVKVQNADQKYGTTTVRYQTGGGAYFVDEIRLGGTKTKLVFEPGSATATK